MRHQDLAKTLVYLAVQTLASQCTDMLLRTASADVKDIVVIAPALGERWSEIGKVEVLVIDRDGAWAIGWGSEQCCEYRLLLS